MTGKQDKGASASQDERAAITAWLMRRADICRDELKNLPWYRPFQRRFVLALGGSFRAAALLIQRGVHYADDLPHETAIIKDALNHNTDEPPCA